MSQEVAADNLRLIMQEIAGLSWEAAMAGQTKEEVLLRVDGAATRLLERIEFAKEEANKAETG